MLDFCYNLKNSFSLKNWESQSFDEIGTVYRSIERYFLVQMAIFILGSKVMTAAFEPGWSGNNAY